MFHSTINALLYQITEDHRGTVAGDLSGDKPFFLCSHRTTCKFTMEIKLHCINLAKDCSKQDTGDSGTIYEGQLTWKCDLDSLRQHQFLFNKSTALARSVTWLLWHQIALSACSTWYLSGYCSQHAAISNANNESDRLLKAAEAPLCCWHARTKRERHSQTPMPARQNHTK